MRSMPSAAPCYAGRSGSWRTTSWSVRWAGSWRGRARIALFVVALGLFVGLGRVYTGAHYPSDVLAGWALGGVWASVCVTAAEVFRRLYDRPADQDELEITTKG